MRVQTWWIRLLAACTVFTVLSYVLRGYGDALRLALARVFYYVEGYFSSESKNITPNLQVVEDILLNALVACPSLLTAIYTYLCLWDWPIRFSLRSLLFMTTATAMYFVFGRRFYWGSDIDSYILGSGYAILLLLLTWVLAVAIREFEIKHRLEQVS